VSDRDTFRAEQQERRQFGKAKQHEKRLERALRKAVAEEIAQALEDRGRDALKRAVDWKPTDSMNFKTQDGAIGLATGYHRASEIAREIGSRDPA
jgi:predicted RecB family nuclease